MLTAATMGLLRELLAWDRQRVARIEAAGTPCPAYRARQDAAEVALAGTPPAVWPQPVREVYQTLIEVLHFELPTDRFGVVIKGVPPVMPRKALFRDAAIEIGVDRILREVVPALFS